MRSVVWAACAQRGVRRRVAAVPHCRPARSSTHSGDVEQAGTQDVIAAALGATALAGGSAEHVQPVRRPTLETGWVIASVIAITFVAVPAMAAEHTHGADHVHAGTTVAADDHAAHEHTDAAAAASADGHHHEVPARLDHDPTDDQMQAAADLIVSTKAATLQYADVKVAEANGYRSIGDGFTGVEHFINREYMYDTDVARSGQSPSRSSYRVQPRQDARVHHGDVHPPERIDDGRCPGHRGQPHALARPRQPVLRPGDVEAERDLRGAARASPRECTCRRRRCCTCG